MDASAYICARAPYFLNSIILHIVWFSPESSILSLWAMAFLTRVILYFSALATWDGTVPADLVLNPPFFLRPISLSSYWKYGTGLYVYLPVWFCTIISWRINYTTIVFFSPLSGVFYRSLSKFIARSSSATKRAHSVSFYRIWELVGPIFLMSWY